MPRTPGGRSPTGRGTGFRFQPVRVRLPSAPRPLADPARLLRNLAGLVVIILRGDPRRPHGAVGPYPAWSGCSVTSVGARSLFGALELAKGSGLPRAHPEAREPRCWQRFSTALTSTRDTGPAPRRPRRLRKYRPGQVCLSGNACLNYRSRPPASSQGTQRHAQQPQSVAANFGAGARPAAHTT